MIGNGYWATGITVRYGYHGSGMYDWSAEVRFRDDGSAGDGDTDSAAVTTEGTLKTRYLVCEGTDPDIDALAVVIDAVKADAERLGITWSGWSGLPTVYYQGDGDDEGYPPPDGWRDMVNAQAIRLGWRPVYAAEEQGQ